jgi:hypothetical protein
MSVCSHRTLSLPCRTRGNSTSGERRVASYRAQPRPARPPAMPPVWHPTPPIARRLLMYFCRNRRTRAQTPHVLLPQSSHPTIARMQADHTAPHGTLAYSSLDMCSAPRVWSGEGTQARSHSCGAAVARVHARYCEMWGPVASYRILPSFTTPCSCCTRATTHAGSPGAPPPHPPA